jgi:hypothetical protein
MLAITTINSTGSAGFAMWHWKPALSARILIIIYNQYAQARNRYPGGQRDRASGPRFAIGAGGQSQSRRLHGDQFALCRHPATFALIPSGIAIHVPP